MKKMIHSFKNKYNIDLVDAVMCISSATCDASQFTNISLNEKHERTSESSTAVNVRYSVCYWINENAFTENASPLVYENEDINDPANIHMGGDFTFSIEDGSVLNSEELEDACLSNFKTEVLKLTI